MLIQTYRPSISKTLAYGNLINKDCPLNRGLVSNWLTLPLLKGRPKLVDIASGYDGTFTGYGSASPWQGALGRPGGFGCVNFDGTDDYVGCGDFTSLLNGQSKATLSFWNYRTTSGGTTGACGFSSGANGRFFILLFNGNVYFVAEAVGVQSFENITDSTTGWHHYVLVYDGTLAASSRISGYRDGLPLSLPGSSTPPTSLNLTTGPFALGRDIGNILWATGFSDDSSIWSNRALSANEVYALYEDSRRGYPERLNWLSGTKYFIGGGTPPAGGNNVIPFLSSRVRGIGVGVTIG